MILIYNILLWISIILASPILLLFVLFSEKRRKTVLHRLTLDTSHFSLLTSHSTLWIHALSVGEVLSAIPIVRELKNTPGTPPIVFSASTYTGFETARKMLNQDADAILYFPYDLSLCVRRAIRFINPSLVVIIETDIWPNFLFTLKQQNIPVILINARLSERSFSGYRRLSFLTKPIFDKFAAICCQTDEDARRFKMLGVSSDLLHITGNLKFDQAEISVSDDELVYLRRMIDPEHNRKIIVAGSTHDGEEKILAGVFSQLRKDFDNLLLILAPRDPKRSGNIRKIFESARLFSELGTDQINGSGKQVSVIIIDRIGILRKLYAIADIAFIGGSMARCGGHNPLEPAVFAKPMLFGTDMSDFQEISEMLLNAGGAIQVRDKKSLYHLLYGLLKHRHIADKTGRAAYDVFSRNRGAVTKTIEVLCSEPFNSQ